MRAAIRDFGCSFPCPCDDLGWPVEDLPETLRAPHPAGPSGRAAPAAPLALHARTALRARWARNAVRPRSACSSRSTPVPLTRACPASLFFAPAPAPLVVSHGAEPARKFPRARGWEPWEPGFGTGISRLFSYLCAKFPSSQASRAHDYVCAHAHTRTLVPLYLLGTLGTIEVRDCKASLNSFQMAGSHANWGWEPWELLAQASENTNKIGGGYAARPVGPADLGLETAEARRNFRLGGAAGRLDRAAGELIDQVRGAAGENGGFLPILRGSLAVVGMPAWEWMAKAARFQGVAPACRQLGRLIHRPSGWVVGRDPSRPGGAPPKSAAPARRSWAQPIFRIWIGTPLQARLGQPGAANLKISGWGTGRGCASAVSGARGSGRGRHGGGERSGAGHGRPLRSRRDGAKPLTLWAGVNHVNA